MGKSLVIVESPAKARTIAKYLGPGFDVKASMGHVRDLPVRRLGVDVDNDFEPSYITIRGQGKTLKTLRSASGKAKEIFLAPDPDREGEAIAWHLAHLLGGKSKRIRRVLFNEITQKVIRQAFDAAEDQIATRLQHGGQLAEDRLLGRSVEIDEQVATQDEIRVEGRAIREYVVLQKLDSGSQAFFHFPPMPRLEPATTQIGRSLG